MSTPAGPPQKQNILDNLVPIIIQSAPSIISGLIAIVSAAASQGGTPAETAAHLKQIADDLKAINDKVQATPLPPVGSGA